MWHFPLELRPAAAVRQFATPGAPFAQCTVRDGRRQNCTALARVVSSPGQRKAPQQLDTLVQRTGDTGASSSAGRTPETLLNNAVVSGLPAAGRPSSTQRQPGAASRPVDFDRLLSLEGRERQPGALTAIVSAYGDMPGMIGMHGGLPHQDAFPFGAFSVTLKDGQHIRVDTPAQVADAQQYNIHVLGYPPLQEWAAAHVAAQHAPPPGVHEVMVSAGSNHTIEMVTALLMDRGDAILCEEFTYFYLVDSVMPTRGYRPVPVAVDAQGMVPAALREVLTRMRARGERLPRLLYTVPTGQNPTGAAMPEARKREIYALCQEWDLILVEDDAYYYLQYPNAGALPALAGLGPSFLSLDTDGRVVRLDSFSKLLAPGFRLGWVAAAPRLTQLMSMHLHASLNGPCSVTQVLLAELLQAWGEAGFATYVTRMQAEYRRRARVLHDACTRELAGLAQWQTPRAGMFLWMRLLAGVSDADQIMGQLRRDKVVVLPGRITHCLGPRPPFPCPFVRLSFASATDEDMRTGIARLAAILREFQAGQTTAVGGWQ